MNLHLILGDQLSHDGAIWQGFDAKKDAVAMVEVLHESQTVWSHKVRTVFFLSAMRHFAEELRAKKIKLHYQKLNDKDAKVTFLESFQHIIAKVKPVKLIVVEAGEYRVQQELVALAKAVKLPLEVRVDDHFYCSKEEFAEHCKGRKQLRMEFFYRELRKRHNILMDGDKPEGGEWNYDHENRKSFGKAGPPARDEFFFEPDKITREVMAVVEEKLPKNPGELSEFQWPVTTAEAEKLLKHFVEKLLPSFGDYQDAMWTGEPYLFHSKLSAAMNVKLLSAKKVVAAVEAAYRKGKVPLPAAEGYIRQILGWREYVRAVYFQFMPQYLERNALNASLPLPAFYWTGKTHMNCMKQTIEQTLKYGYAHHIQRLMVTGLFSLLYGVRPKAIHEWYLAVYLDAIEWVELPNTLGMSQYADGGVMASKPYIASGKYIDRMSNYCQGCKYDPDVAHGETACPFTTLYWDFIQRHEDIIEKNPRLGMQLKNWRKKRPEERKKIIAQAKTLRSKAVEKLN